MAGFSKLFSSIITSSIWSEDHSTVRLWITMLAVKDHAGVVEGSVPGLARIANITREECELALAKFLAPDLDSRNQDHEGRRIEVVPGGWRVLSHEYYRDLQVTREYAMTPEAVRKRNARRGGTSSPGDDSSRTAPDRHGQRPPVSADGRTVYASASASAVVEEGKEREKGEERDTGDAVGHGVTLSQPVTSTGDVEGLLIRHDFGRYAETVRLTLLDLEPAARSAAVGELHDHCEGTNDRERTNPLIVGQAVSEYVLNRPAGAGIHAGYFAGFVNVARSKKQLATEQRHIDAEAKAKVEREREAAETLARQLAAEAEAVRDFPTVHPTAYAMLQARATDEIDTAHPDIVGNWKAQAMRRSMIDGRLHELVQAEVREHGAVTA